MAIHRFHTAKINGVQIDALISSNCSDATPFIQARKLHGEAEVGVSNLRFFSPRSHADAETWWLAKYGNDSSLQLSGFNQQDAKEISKEFGLPFWTPLYKEQYGRAVFYQSPAWHSLCGWLSNHPRAARIYSEIQAVYLPRWYERAIGALPIETIPLDVKRDAFLSRLGLM